ncbi:MAG: aminotransferase class IV [Pleurocapsa sp.]
MFWYGGELINSGQIKLALNEPGLCYGATAFTTMRVYDHSLEAPLTCWQAHCDRLKLTIQAFNWRQPNWQKLKRGAEILLKHFPVLRIAVFPNGKEWIAGRSLPPELKQRQIEGITAWIAKEPMYRRELAEYKTGNYLSAYLAREQALNLNAQEAILIDAQGNWLETSTGNLWGWKDGCWYTPCLNSGILPGIARSRWLTFLQENQIEVSENVWTPEFSQTLTALAYSNCVVNLVPITTVDNSKERVHYSRKLPLNF